MSGPALALWTPLHDLYVCLEGDCAATFPWPAKACPACGSEKITPVARWLDREQGGQ